MAPRWRLKGKSDPSDPSDEAHKAETVVVLTSSDDEKANEDLSLAVIEKANQSKAKAKAKAKAKRKSVEGSLVNISSDEAELDKHEADKTGGEESRKKKRPKKKKKERDAVESETPQADKSEAEPTTAAPEVHNSFVGLTDAEPPGTKEPVFTDGNEAPDNKILRKLLRGARYFDPGERLLGMCFNCGEEGHMAANCLAEKKKKPCFRCGQFGHFGKDCTQGQYCYTCKKNGHKAKECPEKNKNAFENSKVCLKCCEVGHDMFSCASNYPPDDMKEIQCYVCKKEGHFCCAVVSDSSTKVVSCYNCAELGHTGAGCAKPRRETGTVVTSILCYKCGGEGHFARGCRITTGSIVRSVLGITPESKKWKVREREEKFGFRSAPEGKMGMKRKGTKYDKKGSTSTPPKSRRKGGMLDARDDFPSSSSSKKFKPKIFGQKDRSYGNSGYERDYSTPYSSEKQHWQGHSSPRINNKWNQHKPRYSESRYSNSHTRFSHTYE